MFSQQTKIFPFHLDFGPLVKKLESHVLVVLYTEYGLKIWTRGKRSRVACTSVLFGLDTLSNLPFIGILSLEFSLEFSHLFRPCLYALSLGPL